MTVRYVTVALTTVKQVTNSLSMKAFRKKKSQCDFLRRLKQKSTIFVLAQSFSKKWNQSSAVQRGYDSTSSKTLGTSPAVSGALPRISENLLKVSKNSLIINKHFINDTEGREGERQSCFLLLLARFVEHSVAYRQAVLSITRLVEFITAVLYLPCWLYMLKRKQSSGK